MTDTLADPKLLLLIIAAVAVLLIAGQIATEGLPDIDLGALIMEASEKAKLADIDTSKSHAETKHGSDITNKIRECNDNGGLMQTWQRGSRYIQVCILPDDQGKPDLEHWGIQICEDDPSCGFVEITCFDLDCNANEMEWYLGGRGYAQIQ